MKNLLFLVLIMALSILVAFADNTDTRRKSSQTMKPVVEKLQQMNGVDSCGIADLIEIAGYEKKMQDRDETFYVTNDTPFRLSKLVVRFSYKSLSGDMLHEEVYEIPCDIPSGETRRLAVRSWDKQHSHYYYKSRKPKSSAIPYQVGYAILRYDVAVEVVR